ncbi:uncharacterized protein KZ484_013584 [Pholidichthys leucotaenia]
MAEVRQCCGRGTPRFVNQLYNCYLLRSCHVHENNAVRVSNLSMRFLSGDTENAVNGATVGVCPGGYTRVKTLYGDRRVVGIRHDRGVEEYPLFSNSYAEFLRTFSPPLRRQKWPYSWKLHGQVTFKRFFSDSGARSEPLYKTKTGYYEILEVSPTATQTQIKTAYYKQSFVYHPDRNAGSDEATVRFSEITEAYNVLGNKALRKKYDRGLLSVADITSAARPSAKDSATGGSAKKQAGSRRSVMDMGGRGSVFDFDEFYRSHYSEQLHRQKDIKARKEEILKEKQQSTADKNMGRMMEIGVGMMFLLACGILMNLK